MTLKVVTANRLIDGDVVYLTAKGDWSDWLDDSGPAETPEHEAALLDLAAQAVHARLVVDPYLMPVAQDEGHLRPLSQREIIRAAGPSVRTDLGKQAAIEWLTENVELVDENGDSIDRADLEYPEPPDADQEASVDADDEEEE